MTSEKTGQKPTKGKGCTKCKQWKPLPSFNKQAGTKDGLKYHCKECCKDHYKKAIERLKAYIKLRGNKCELCGVSYSYEVYDFHHIDPDEKEMQLVTRMWRGTKMYAKTLIEAEKCALVCSNCHRSIHAALRKGITLLIKRGKNVKHRK